MDNFEETLQTVVKRGEIAIFSVLDKETRERHTEYLDGQEIRDMLTEQNSERLAHLVQMYAGDAVDIDGELYSLVAGQNLISYLMEETTSFIREDVLQTPYVDEQQIKDFLERRSADDIR